MILSFPSKCQNLVVNYSFEDTIPCISNPFFGMPETAPPWESYRQTPDFWSLTYCGGGMPFGFQLPKSGESTVGIGVYDSLSLLANEVFGQELNDSLIQGHTYCVSFFVSLANISKFGIDKLGALFTSFKPDPAFLGNFTAIPQVENQSGQIITDTLNWIQITDSFVAQGGEKFISLGNFNAPGNFQIISLPYPTSSTFSYYYFDDISIVDCTVGIEELSTNYNIELYPNPAMDEVNISVENPNLNITSIEIYNTLGDKVTFENKLNDQQKSFNIKKLAPGIYLVKISMLGSIIIKRFVKN